MLEFIGSKKFLLTFLTHAWLINSEVFQRWMKYVVVSEKNEHEMLDIQMDCFDLNIFWVSRCLGLGFLMVNFGASLNKI